MRAIVVVVLVACGATPRDPGIVNTTPAAVGCPAAENVWLASFGGEGTRWVLPFGAQIVDGATDPTDRMAITEKTMAEDKAASRIPKLHPWLLLPGRAPCELTLGARSVETVTNGPLNRSFRYELQGCPLPEDGKATAAIVVFAPSAPTDCRVVPSHLVAEFKDYKGGSKPPPLPAELANLVGGAEHGKIHLWRIHAIDVRNKPVFWSIDTTAMKIGKSDDECDWDTTNLGMMYERSKGAIVSFSYSQPRDLMSVYQYLFGALVDSDGIRSVVVTNLGEYQVFDLTKTPRVVGHHLRWYFPNEEEYAADGVLGPYCGP